MKVLFTVMAVMMVVKPLSLSLSHPDGDTLQRVEHQRARWPNGRLRFEATVVDQAYHGEYRTWYPSGAPYEMRHFVHGHEEGVQQSWTGEGVLFLNYEVRQGRRYGFVNAKPCQPVGEATP